jgi:hypothetical protein
MNGLTGLIHGTIQVLPLAFDPNVRLAEPPADPHGPLAAVKRCFQRPILALPNDRQGLVQETHGLLRGGGVPQLGERLAFSQAMLPLPGKRQGLLEEGRGRLGLPQRLVCFSQAEEHPALPSLVKQTALRTWLGCHDLEPPTAP